MFAKENLVIYRKLVILAILSGCVYVFGASEGATANARTSAPCFQECDAIYNSCIDECQSSCDDETGSQAACHSCIGSCSSSKNACYGYAVYCEQDPASPGVCATQYGLVCPIIGGDVHCELGQNRYYLLCNWENGYCVDCFSQYCYGPGMPHCVTQ